MQTLVTGTSPNPVEIMPSDGSFVFKLALLVKRNEDQKVLSTFIEKENRKVETGVHRY